MLRDEYDQVRGMYERNKVSIEGLFVGTNNSNTSDPSAGDGSSKS